MTVALAAVRAYALSLPSVTEEPHFDLSSWRVAGKIFATIPPEPQRLRLFVDEAESRSLTTSQPQVYEELWWGRRLAGVTVRLDAADRRQMFELVESAWRRRAPRTLVREYDRSRS